MLGFDDAKGLVDLVLRGVDALRDRLDPARRQAQRLISAFDTYGIARQQIPRLLPRRLRLQPAALSTPGKLKSHLTSGHLDWAAEYLALQRKWFDGVEAHPHLSENFYKAPGRFREWLINRQRLAPGVPRFLLVWKSARETVGPEAVGPLCVVYEEMSEGLDGMELSRYWLLSDGWSWRHSPCVENMVAAVAIARSLGVQVLGHNIPDTLLKHLEAGTKLAPLIFRQRRGLWYPDDLIVPVPGTDSAWRQAVWKGARRWLAADRVDTS